MRQFSLIALLLCLYAATPLAAERIDKVSGSRYETAEQTITLQPQEFDNLSFTASSYMGGTLKLRTVDSTDAVIRYTKVLKANSTSQAEDFADYIDVKYEELENELSISAETSSRPPWSGTDYSGRLEIEIDIPHNAELKVLIRTTAFNIEVAGPLATADISNEFGDILVSDITRKVKVSTENSGVKVVRCNGPVTVRTSSRPIMLADIDSKLGTVMLRNTNGQIVLDRVKGELDVRTELAPIRASSITLESGRSKIRTESATLQLNLLGLNGDLTLIDSNGKIELGLPPDVDARYSLRVDDGGRIYSSGIPIKTDLVTRTRLNGRSGDGQHEIDVDMRGVGTISLRQLSTDEL